MFNDGEDITSLEDVFLVVVRSVDDPDVEFCTLVSGLRELANFLLHYDKDMYEFCSSEKLCDGNRMFWNHRELLKQPERNFETGEK